MRWQRRFILFFLAPLPTLFSDTIEAGRDTEDNDIRALKEWIDTKRQISLKEIGGDLSLSGEVRTEFQSAWETRNGESLRGSDPLRKLPSRGFDIEFNFMLDYRTDFTWASVKIEYDDDMGVFNGTLDHLALERAYFGVRPISCDTYTFDIEVGRRSMSSIFDSKVQFGSFFDGVVFRYDRAFENVGDYYLRIGPYIINERRDHFGYAGEMGLLNIKGTGFYGKFSTIAWYTRDYPKVPLSEYDDTFLIPYPAEFNEDYRSNFVTDRFRFIISQFTAGYRFRIECIDKLGLVYSAFLNNWAAKKLPVSDFKRAQWGFYAGLSLGQLLKQWDWAFDANYQLVLAQAIPDFDASGISLGNADRSGFYTNFLRPLEGRGSSTPPTAAGSTNYHGYIFRVDYLLTDKLDMQQLFLQSWTFDEDIGPKRSFIQYELEFIFSW